MLAGPRNVMRDCIRHRRMFGGAMRQVGILAAAGLYALDHHIDRLADDHDNAKLIASRLRANRRVTLIADPPDTNIVIFSLSPDAPDAPALVTAARAKGVLIVAFGPRTVRAVTHLDVSRDDCEHAASVLLDCVGS
jgi:threonine aldolase